MIARALGVADLDDLTALRLEGIRLFPGAFLPTEDEALAAPANALRDWTTSGSAFGVEQGGRLIGLAGMRRMGGAQTRHRLQIGPFYVTPDRHGSGAADKLMDHLAETGRSAGASQLEL